MKGQPFGLMCARTRVIQEQIPVSQCVPLKQTKNKQTPRKTNLPQTGVVAVVSPEMTKQDQLERSHQVQWCFCSPTYLQPFQHLVDQVLDLFITEFMSHDLL